MRAESGQQTTVRLCHSETPLPNHDPRFWCFCFLDLFCRGDCTERVGVGVQKPRVQDFRWAEGLLTRADNRTWRMDFEFIACLYNVLLRRAQLRDHRVDRRLGEAAVALQQLLAVAARDELEHEPHLVAAQVQVFPAHDVRVVAEPVQQLVLVPQHLHDPRPVGPLQPALRQLARALPAARPLRRHVHARRHPVAQLLLHSALKTTASSRRAQEGIL